MRPSAVLIMYITYLDNSILLVKNKENELFGFPEEIIDDGCTIDYYINKIFDNLSINLDYDRLKYHGYNDSLQRKSIVHIFAYTDFFTPELDMKKYTDFQFTSFIDTGIKLVQNHKQILNDFLMHEINQQ